MGVSENGNYKVKILDGEYSIDLLFSKNNGEQWAGFSADKDMLLLISQAIIDYLGISNNEK